jgi:hypothetical protein
MQHTPYREPLRTTLIRTVAIAAVVGAVVALQMGKPARWPFATLVMLWPSLGGHFVELFFLNYLRPRVPGGRAALIAIRVALWVGGGVALFAGARWTATALGGLPGVDRLAWWIGGVALVAIELVAHLILRLAGRPSFYDGRG